ncbi:MAG TPA: class I SAM-dependent methyltransferase, partial [Casimicrobiaceae bacterium]|nr:class I SAM-dependent methyltransferase [Casimicrobiaceae bacterium]
MNPHAAPALTFTGERFTPEVRGAIWYEHWHRYCAASRIAAGKRVVDAACGEGYGSLLLAGSAQSVVGVDIGAQAVEHARQRYRAPNLRFECASVTALPLPDASVDVVVSFETIEHLAEQEE